MSQLCGHDVSLSAGNRTSKPITEVIWWECDDTRGVLLLGIVVDKQNSSAYEITEATLSNERDNPLAVNGMTTFPSQYREATNDVLLFCPFFFVWPFRRVGLEPYILEVKVELQPGALLSILPLTKPRKPISLKEEGPWNNKLEWRDEVPGGWVRKNRRAK